MDFICRYARSFPRQTLGPPLNATNLNDSVASNVFPSAASHLSGRKSMQSHPTLTSSSRRRRWIPSGSTSSSAACFESSGTEGYSRSVSVSAAFRYTSWSASSYSSGASNHRATSPPRVSRRTLHISATIFSSTAGCRMTSQKNQQSAAEEVSRPARMKLRATCRRKSSE
ncbi:unnamed protein product [Spirodela intermedia]|uniref:Uncharacterized protein n=1 Tax=Spirodela intermedia TaxID=51605 RepID=A0A7I8IEP5_SPIIN|nr:unnamed protein product [Spirodela intermedia]CAA6655573.1 unnamed protein product [Spirodela intermedia]